MLKRTVKNAVSVIWSIPRFGFLKLLHWNGITFSAVERISPNCSVDFVRGKLTMGKRVRIHHGTKLLVDGGKLDIGDCVAINVNCGIYCFDEITIGAGTEFGPMVLVYDHDHDFRCEGGLKAGRYQTAPVRIGKNVWIGAGTVILRGTTIGDNSVIGAGCVVRGDIPPNSILTQKRINEFRVY